MLAMRAEEKHSKEERKERGVEGGEGMRGRETWGGGEEIGRE